MKKSHQRLVCVAAALLLVGSMVGACGSESRDFAESPGAAGSSSGAAGDESGRGNAAGAAAASNVGGDAAVNTVGGSASGGAGPDGNVGPKGLGEACSAGAECTSGECVDEVCCESACDGVCQACVEDSTGEPDGSCASIASGPDPDADLQSDSDHCGTCEVACTGSSLPGTSGVCSAGQCSVTCPAGTIGDGVSACIPAMTVTAGAAFSCGLLQDGHVECWGNPDLDLNPDGLDNVLFRSITAASSFVCGIRDNGLAQCWGSNAPVPSSGVFHALAAGNTHVCGIRANGTLSCWGNTDGEVLTPPPGTYRFVASGSEYSCALVSGGALDGRATCWGEGTGITPDFPKTSNAMTFTQIFGAGIAGWGVLPNGTLHSWGQVYFTGPASSVFKTVGAGASASRCGILSDHSLACWGTPGSAVAIAPSGSFSAITLGGSHACAVKTTGSIQCWGSNDVGQAPANVTGPFQGYW